MTKHDRIQSKNEFISVLINTYKTLVDNRKYTSARIMILALHCLYIVYSNIINVIDMRWDKVRSRDSR